MWFTPNFPCTELWHWSRVPDDSVSCYGYMAYLIIFLRNYVASMPLFIFCEAIGYVLLVYATYLHLKLSSQKELFLTFKKKNFFFENEPERTWETKKRTKIDVLFFTWMTGSFLRLFYVDAVFTVAASTGCMNPRIAVHVRLLSRVSWNRLVSSRAVVAGKEKSPTEVSLKYETG
jgi:hypothetical protein